MVISMSLSHTDIKVGVIIMNLLCFLLPVPDNSKATKHRFSMMYLPSSSDSKGGSAFVFFKFLKKIG